MAILFVTFTAASAYSVKAEYSTADRSCPIFINAPTIAQNLDPSHDGLERLVIFLYKKPGTKEITTFIPSKNYQNCIQDLPAVESAIYQNDGSDTMRHLFERSPSRSARFWEEFRDNRDYSPDSSIDTDTDGSGNYENVPSWQIPVDNPITGKVVDTYPYGSHETYYANQDIPYYEQHSISPYLETGSRELTSIEARPFEGYEHDGHTKVLPFEVSHNDIKMIFHSPDPHLIHSGPQQVPDQNTVQDNFNINLPVNFSPIHFPDAYLPSKKPNSNTEGVEVTPSGFPSQKPNLSSDSLVIINHKNKPWEYYSKGNSGEDSSSQYPIYSPYQSVSDFYQALDESNKVPKPLESSEIQYPPYDKKTSSQGPDMWGYYDAGAKSTGTLHSDKYSQINQDLDNNPKLRPDSSQNSKPLPYKLPQAQDEPQNIAYHWQRVKVPRLDSKGRIHGWTWQMVRLPKTLSSLEMNFWERIKKYNNFVRHRKPERTQIYDQKHDVDSFSHWVKKQLKGIKGDGTKIPTSAADITLVKKAIEVALKGNGMRVTSSGSLTDGKGYISSLNNLKLRPFLIGKSFAYDTFLKGTDQMLSDTLFLQGLLVSLLNPPKVLGIVPLGITALPQKLDFTNEKHLLEIKGPLNVAEKGILTSNILPLLLRRKIVETNRMNEVQEVNEDATSPDYEGVQETVTLNDAKDMVEDVKSAESDEAPGFRIIGGSVATGSGTPLVFKGRSGFGE